VKKVVFAGNAISAEILYSYISRDERYEVVATTVDEDFLHLGSFDKVPGVALSQLRESYPSSEVCIIMAVGYDNLNKTRESLFGRLRAMGYSIETYIHPDAKIYTEHTLGAGSVVLPNAVIEPHVYVGENTMIWCNTTLAHHSKIDDHCWIASGAVISGQAVIERNTFVGVNATVVNKITVGEYSILGAGALITKDIKPQTVNIARSAEQLRYSASDYVKYFGV